MSFAAPAFLAAGIMAALVVTALHFLARQRPRSAVFPTARFIPEKTARAPSRAVKPSDLLLLALRAAALIMLGAAFARPAWDASRAGTARVVLLDRSRAVRSAAEARDTALALLRDGDALVIYDTAARVASRDSAVALKVSGARGSLSGALVAAQQAAASIARKSDSIELVIVSPLAREEFDAATNAIRAQWEGRVRVVRIGIAAMDSAKRGVSVRGDAGDALASSGIGNRESGRGARAVRGTAARGDSLWASDSGGALVIWPARSPGVPHDTIGALAMGDDVVVAPFVRMPLPIPDSRFPAVQVVARWSDGRVAASELRTGSGCIRTVSIPVPSAGDLVLREDFRRVAAGLTGPCGERDLRAAPDSSVAHLAGKGTLAPARGWSQSSDGAPPLARWLLVAAALLLVAEPLVRRRSA